MSRPALFPSFFMGGFECATLRDRTDTRRDYVALTQHDRFLREDYAFAKETGLRVVREGVRWHLCDRRGSGGGYTFDSIAPMVEVAQELGLTLIHCLFHYGYPDDVGIDDEASFVGRFADFAGAFAVWRRERVDGPRWYVPINEPSLFTFAVDQGWFASCVPGDGERIKRMLLRAYVAAGDSIRVEDPAARFIAIDPLVHYVAPRSHPERAREAAERNERQWEFWDLLAGKREPELGGGPQYVDVMGVNCYPDQQKEVGGPEQLALDDPRRRPFREMLREVCERYGRPAIVAELGARHDERPVWARTIVDECLSALADGVDLQGICFYPLVDIHEWKHGDYGDLGHLGLLEVEERGDALPRRVNEPYLAAVRAAEGRAHESGRLPR